MAPTWLKNVLEDGTELKLLQPTDDFAERLHRQQPLARAPLQGSTAVL